MKWKWRGRRRKRREGEGEEEEWGGCSTYPELCTAVAVLVGLVLRQLNKSISNLCLVPSLGLRINYILSTKNLNI